ncbi:N-methylhydantoinase A [Natronoarchaeum philippinense]|uniref:N-methylhydantoinase A n=1 Tax=Natronoarchaeum philippinense TaxID=558529 RepID=A0A285NV16_NATPI|nr:hydantoinase/oxoprolinase family protein [Natronoarchaeum philippinense]SNZ13078.1 N-methylhydantoinase A [Natronoarchaeum philippinense]
MRENADGNADRELRVGVDVGGTFTDVVLVDAAAEAASESGSRAASSDDADAAPNSGRLVTAKVPTTADQSEGVLAGIKKACRAAGVEPDGIDRFRHATTVTVNALLEGRGAKTALVTTEGFRDVLEIRRQDRPALYDFDATPPDPVVPRRRRFEVDERATPEGIEQSVDEGEVRDLAADLRERAVESVAVAFLHAYAHPENERRAAAVLREELDVPVSASHEVLAEFREYERTATTALDAAVRPVVDEYLERLVERAADAGVPAPRVMQSNGGIADAETVRERAITTALSGPAAGVVGAGEIAEGALDGGRGEGDSNGAAALAEYDGVVTVDMGGTSTDVSLVRDGGAERTTDAEIGGRPIGLPVVDVTTVGAGGGSLAGVDAGGALTVGPESAGAEPGPACYGRGGTEPTVTDAAVVLGYVGADAELGGELSIDADAARSALADLADAADLDGALAAARGVHEVALARTTRAIRSATVERGLDPREFALAAFGGAGPMHAAALADRLGIDAVLVPRACGVLSAYGLLAADEAHDAARTHRTQLSADADRAAIEERYEGLREEVLASASDPAAARVERSADLRYAGQSFELEVEADEPVDPAALAERFHEAHERTRGYRMDEAVELVTLRARAVVPGRELPIGYQSSADARRGEREVTFGADGPVSTPIYDRAGLDAGREIDGPAVVEQAESTTVVPPDWRAAVQGDGTLLLTRGEGDA